ncbi:PECT1 [Symbiodinium natans]|uniref:PECT1 protein n=1 Tax=Symbiodinium natans TaxID=878477 RepID=A0A812TLJ1_9DINO|nr:PECT1 [Symbiodinium natans]
MLNFAMIRLVCAGQCAANGSAAEAGTQTGRGEKPSGTEGEAPRCNKTSRAAQQLFDIPVFDVPRLNHVYDHFGTARVFLQTAAKLSGKTWPAPHHQTIAELM